MVKLSSSLKDQMIKQAREQLPLECCGILAGKVNGDITVVNAIFPMTNVDQSPENFSMDPKEQFRVCHIIRKMGLKMLGNYHSHPETPSRPSKEDIRLAHDPKAIYMIISLREETPVLKCFNIEGGTYLEMPLIIVKEHQKNEV